MIYKILDNLPQDQILPEAPALLWLILTLEIVIKDEHGYYFLLTFPSYALKYKDKHNIKEGYWAPPFFGFPVPFGFSAPDTVGSVKDLFKNFEKTIDIDKYIGELAYLMGLTDPQIKQIGSFIELKTSPRSPDLTKCYKIIRFMCDKVGNRGRQNLADPECRKAYTFLPLLDLKDMIIKKYNSKYGQEKWFFLSKPIMSNVQFILSSPDGLDQLMSRAIQLYPADFMNKERGIIICADLAGYGSACKYAIENMHTFDKRGAEIANRFRESVSVLFYKLLTKIGISQVHTTGDGFICALPERAFFNNDISKTLQYFIQNYISFLDIINTFNTYILDPKKRLGSRLALHYGDYKYGRIAQGRSHTADFDGASIIDVARLEAILRKFTKGPLKMRILDSQTDIPAEIVEDNRNVSNHNYETNSNIHRSEVDISSTMICSQEIIDKATNFFKDCAQFRRITSLSVGIKEFETKASIYKFV